jgi:hypothetical protein
VEIVKGAKTESEQEIVPNLEQNPSEGPVDRERGEVTHRGRTQTSKSLPMGGKNEFKNYSLQTRLFKSSTRISDNQMRIK